MMFALFMIVILIVTGFIWLLDILVLRKKRAAGVDEPILVEYAKSFFSGDTGSVLCPFVYCRTVQDSFRVHDAYLAGG